MFDFSFQILSNPAFQISDNFLFKSKLYPEGYKMVFFFFVSAMRKQSENLTEEKSQHAYVFPILKKYWNNKEQFVH